jgi:large subunit ribosomal protein L18
MNQHKMKTKRRTRRKARIRKTLMGTSERPRLSIYRTAQHIYAQLIDDLAGKTLASASSRSKSLRDGIQKGSNRDGATLVGKALGEQAVSGGYSSIVFDRNGYRFHGRVKALADAAREAGLKF